MRTTESLSRRAFLGTVGAGASAALWAQERYDIVIRGGELCDPSQKLRRRAALGIRDGKIAAIEEDIAASRGLQVIDAKGSFVTPGLVDLHTHCYFGATGLGIEADPIAARSGVTTWVDAGSFGYDQVEGFRRFIVAPAKARI